MMNSFRKARINSGHIRQEDVAKILGVDRTTISKWEIGDSHPRIEMLKKLAALYGCTIDALLTPDPNTQPSDDAADTA